MCKNFKFYLAFAILITSVCALTITPLATFGFTPSYAGGSTSSGGSTNSSSYTPSYSTNSSSYTPSSSTNSSSYTPSYSTNSSSYTPSYSTNSSSYTPSYSTNSSSYTPSSSTNSSSYNCTSASCYSSYSSYSSSKKSSTSTTYAVYTPPSCTNECSVNGQRVCIGNGWRQCGNYDSDSCLEWGNITQCGWNQTCSNGQCISTCTNECSVSGQRVCDGNGWKQCGNYDSDSCLEWGNITQCGWNQTCSNGSCIDTCQNECTLNQHQCSGNSGRTCLQNNQGCTYWGNYQSCDSQCYSCGDGRCECGETRSSCPQDCGYNTPTVNLDYYGEVECGQKATLHWTSNNADSCSASGSWSGSKSTSGSEQVGNFTGSRTFTLTCTGSGGSASDSVTIYGTADDLDVDAGPDKYIDAGESVRLDGSVDGNYDYVRWSCTGGSLSDYDILRPTYRAPYDYDYDYSRTYTCTLTARNECGSDSDTMTVRVEYDGDDRDFDVALIARPKSDCAPLYDVDLIATVSNWRDYDYDYDYYGDSYYRRDQEFTYYFDCENDGSWDKTVTTDNTSYTALNLCDYHNVGSYTARVRVERGSRTATDTEIVRAESCGVTQIGNVSITKTVNNVSTGTGYQGTVTANPLNTVSYRIVITGTSGTAANVTVSDAIPSGITNVRDVQVDGYSTGGNITSGISLGTITSGQTKTITYNATVANETSFVYGQTTLNNVATVTVDGKSANSSAAVQVYRRAVMGATTISTGIGSDTIIALGIALLAAIACLVWVAKDNIAAIFKPKKQAYEY